MTDLHYVLDALTTAGSGEAPARPEDRGVLFVGALLSLGWALALALTF